MENLTTSRYISKTTSRHPILVVTIGFLSVFIGLLFAFEMGHIAIFALLIGGFLIVLLRNIKFGIWLFPIVTFFSTYDPLGIGFSPEKILMVVVIVLWLIQIKEHKTEKRNLALSVLSLSFLFYIIVCFSSSILSKASTSVNLSVLQSLISKALLVFLVYKILSGYEDIRNIYYSLAILSTLMLMWMIIVIILREDILFFRVRPEDELMVMSSTFTIFANPNIPSFYGITLFPLIFSFAKVQTRFLDRIIFKTVSFFLVLVVLLTFSRSGLIALFIVMMFLAFKIRPRKEIFVIICVIAIGIWLLIGNTPFFFQNIHNVLIGVDSSALARVGILKASWISFLENPILGVGYGNFSNHMIRFYSIIRELPGSSLLGISSHNDWLNILVETGILGVISFSAVVFSLIIILIGINKKISKYQHLRYIFIGINGSLLAALVDSFFHRAMNHNLLWFVIALALLFLKISSREHESSLRT